MEISESTLRGLLGPSYKVAADKDDEGTIYVLSNDGTLAVYLNGIRTRVPDVVKDVIVRKQFPEPQPVLPPKVNKMKLSDMPYETQERFNSAVDILAGVRAGATREDRRRAKNYVQIVLDSIKNSDS